MTIIVRTPRFSGTVGVSSVPGVAGFGVAGEVVKLEDVGDGVVGRGVGVAG